MGGLLGIKHNDIPLSRQEIKLNKNETISITYNLYGIIAIRNETCGQTALITLNNGSYLTEIINGRGFGLLKDISDSVNVYSDNTEGVIKIQNIKDDEQCIKYSVL